MLRRLAATAGVIGGLSLFAVTPVASATFTFESLWLDTHTSTPLPSPSVTTTKPLKPGAYYSRS